MKSFAYKNRYWIYVIITIPAIVMLFWKCKWGYATLDEAFYPTIAYRFLQGDRMLFDEWSNTQLSSLVIMPFLKAFMAINGGTVGIYLCVRYTYTVMKIFISIYVFLVIRKKYDDIKAFFSAFLFLVFAGYGLMVLSYNSIAISGFLLFVLLVFDSDDSASGWVKRILSGICLSISVFGIPYMAALYILYFLAVIVVYKLKERESNLTIIRFYSINSFIGTTIGVGVSVIAFCIYTFRRVSIAQIIQTIPHILYGDPSHAPKSLYQKTLAYFVRIFFGNHRNYTVLIVYFVIAALILLFLLDKNRGNHRNNYIMSSMLAGGCLLIAYIVSDNYINDIIFVPSIVAFLVFIFASNEETNELFACIWLPGMAFTYFEYLASNTGFSGIASASCIATVGSIIMILYTVDEMKEHTKLKIPVIIFCVLEIVCCIYYRATYVFWEEGGLGSLTRRIEDGVCAGLKVTDEEYEHYYSVMSDVKNIQDMPADTKVLYIGDKVLWMAGDQKCASYSPLCYSISKDRSILYEYYKEHPDKVADVIYVEEEYGLDITEEIAETLGYSYIKGEIGWIMKKDRIVP